MLFFQPCRTGGQGWKDISAEGKSPPNFHRTHHSVLQLAGWSLVINVLNSNFKMTFQMLKSQQNGLDLCAMTFRSWQHRFNFVLIQKSPFRQRSCWYPQSLLHHISWLLALKVDDFSDWNTFLPRIGTHNHVVTFLVPPGSEHIHDSRFCKQKEGQDTVLQCLKYIFWSVYTSVWTQRKPYHLPLCLSLACWCD